jgi:single-stranded DNA-binding protein
MNSVNLIGHLTKDPKIVERGRRTICEMRVAVDNPGQRTTYIEVRSFDEPAYACAEFLVKGQRVGVSGSLVYDYWKTAAGDFCERYLVVGHVDFLDRAKDPGCQIDAEPPYTPEQSAEELLAA